VIITDDFFSDLIMQKKLTEQFKDKFDGIEPQFIARAPGRVNLIGMPLLHICCC